MELLMNKNKLIGALGSSWIKLCSGNHNPTLPDDVCDAISRMHVIEPWKLLGLWGLWFLEEINLNTWEDQLNEPKTRIVITAQMWGKHSWADLVITHQRVFFIWELVNNVILCDPQQEK